MEITFLFQYIFGISGPVLTTLIYEGDSSDLALGNRPGKGLLR